MKKPKSLKNRTTFKADPTKRKSGTFTQVPYSILHNPNLSPIAKVLLIQILSDSDNFTLSPSMYAHRNGVTIKTIYNALRELEEAGYLRRTPINEAIAGHRKANSEKKLYHYTVSEFGNLNPVSPDHVPGEHDPGTTLQEPDKNNNATATVKPTATQIDEFQNLIASNQFMKGAVQLVDSSDIKDYATDATHFSTLCSRIERKAKELQKEHFNDTIQGLKNFNNYPESLQSKMKDWLKHVVYVECRKLEESTSGALNAAGMRWQTLRSEYNRKLRKTDHETESADQKEQNYHDLR